MRASWLWLLLTCWFAVVAPAGAQDASSDDREARKQFQTGKQAFDDGRFEEALVAFERAYELSPRPMLLYNIAKSEDNLGQKREAREHYRRFLAAVPETQNRGLVERRITELDTEIAREPPPVATPAEAAETVVTSEPVSESAPLAPAAPEKSERIHKKWWFWTGLGAVVAGGLVAGILATRDSGGGEASPVLLNEMTRVKEL